MEKKVHFYNSARQRLAGIIYIPKKTPAPSIVIVHGFASSKLHKKHWAEILCRKGFFVLIFDFHGHGESQGNFTDMTITHCVDDLKSAVDFSRSCKYSDGKIGIVGTSMGGQITTIYASKYNPDAIVPIAATYDLDDTYMKSGVDIETWKKEGVKYFDVRIGKKGIRKSRPLKFSYYLDRRKYNMKKLTPKIKSPILLIHGDVDKIVPLKASKSYYRSANKPKKLFVIKGLPHVIRKKNHIKIICNEITKWFNKYLKN